MTALNKSLLPFFPSLEALVRVVGQTPSSFFLDSSQGSHADSRYSYAGMNPRWIVSGDEDPWQAVALRQDEWKEAPSDVDYFTGGPVGYLAFENYRFLDPFKRIKPWQGPIPGLWLGFYDAVLVLDHERQISFLASTYLSDQALNQVRDDWVHRLEASSQDAQLPNSPSHLIRIPDKTNFMERVEIIKEYLRAGDVYQVNLTESFEAEIFSSAASVYQQLRRVSPVPYGAFLNAGSFQVLSASPELFIKIDAQGHLSTRPIKGTRPRSADQNQDQEEAADLLRAEKDRAELLMIVDLERNDLGKICEYGSVRTDSLYSIESFAQVHHLVATVSGKLKKGVSPFEALKALFPGGSVTGAPKKRALEIIEELEKGPRSLYTGALGYWNGNTCALNIPIRTMILQDNRAVFHAGCGIVIDSDPVKEYDEMLAKAEAMRLSVLGESERKL